MDDNYFFAESVVVCDGLKHIFFVSEITVLDLVFLRTHLVASALLLKVMSDTSYRVRSMMPMISVTYRWEHLHVVM